MEAVWNRCKTGAIINPTSDEVGERMAARSGSNEKVPERVRRIYEAAYRFSAPEHAQTVTWAAINGFRYADMDRLRGFTMTRTAFNAALEAVLEAVNAPGSDAP